MLEQTDVDVGLLDYSGILWKFTQWLIKYDSKNCSYFCKYDQVHHQGQLPFDIYIDLDNDSISSREMDMSGIQG